MAQRMRSEHSEVMEMAASSTAAALPVFCAVSPSRHHCVRRKRGPTCRRACRKTAQIQSYCLSRLQLNCAPRGRKRRQQQQQKELPKLLSRALCRKQANTKGARFLTGMSVATYGSHAGSFCNCGGEPNDTLTLDWHLWYHRRKMPNWNSTDIPPHPNRRRYARAAEKAAGRRPHLFLALESVNLSCGETGGLIASLQFMSAAIPEGKGA